MSWKDVGEDVRDIACGLSSQGFRLRIVVPSCPVRVEWIFPISGFVCDGATTTIYPTNTAEECAYIIQDSESRIVFAENEEQVDKLVEQRDHLPSVDKVIVFDGHGGHDGWVMTLDALRDGNQSMPRIPTYERAFSRLSQTTLPH